MDHDVLRTELFKAHGVRLHPQDPLLLFATVHERLMASATAELRVVMDRAIEQVAASHAAAQQAAERSGEALVKRAAQALGDQLQIDARRAAEMALRPVQDAVERAEKSAWRAELCCWVTGGISLAVLAWAVGLVFRPEIAALLFG